MFVSSREFVSLLHLIVGWLSVCRISQTLGRGPLKVLN